MSVQSEKYQSILNIVAGAGASLVAVSKMKSASDILTLYNAGQRDFGENYVQELLAKQQSLPPDIRWHFIGHLQSNKVKFIVPFVHLIHGVDSMKLLNAIDKEGSKFKRKINCLLQLYVAREETKFGLNKNEIFDLLNQWQDSENSGYVQICGVMGMASYTDDETTLRQEFSEIRNTFEEIKTKYFSADTFFNTISMGMSSDFELALDCGSNMVRIGSLLFGARS